MFLYHSLRVEHRRDAANRFAHQLQPGERKLAVRFRVIKGNDLILEQLVKTAGVHLLLKFRAAVIDLSANGPSIATVVAFPPPAIEHAQVNSAVRSEEHTSEL